MLVVYDSDNKIIGTVHNPTKAVVERMKDTGQKFFIADRKMPTANMYVEFDEKGKPRLAPKRRCSIWLEAIDAKEFRIYNVTPETLVIAETKTNLVFQEYPEGNTFEFSLINPGLYRITCQELRTEHKSFVINVE